jgi:YHS domain-containing protein
MSKTEKPIDPIREIEVLSEDAKFTVELNAHYYFRMNQFLFEAFPKKDDQHFLELLDLVKNGEEEKDRMAYHLSTLISLMTVMEDSARAQNFMKKIKINTETGEKIESPQ